MKGAWIASGCMAVMILAGSIALGLAVNAGACFNPSFAGMATYYGVTILFAVPIWILILLANGFLENRETVLIGLGTFLLFLGLAAFPVITVIGIWLICIKIDWK